MTTSACTRVPSANSTSSSCSRAMFGRGSIVPCGDAVEDAAGDRRVRLAELVVGLGEAVLLRAAVARLDHELAEELADAERQPAGGEDRVLAVDAACRRRTSGRSTRRGAPRGRCSARRSSPRRRCPSRCCPSRGRRRPCPSATRCRRSRARASARPGTRRRPGRPARASACPSGGRWRRAACRSAACARPASRAPTCRRAASRRARRRSRSGSGRGSRSGRRTRRSTRRSGRGAGSRDRTSASGSPSTASARARC